MKGVLSFFLSAAVIAVALFVAFLLNKFVPEDKPSRFNDPNLHLKWIRDSYRTWGWLSDTPQPAPLPCAAGPMPGELILDPLSQSRAGEGAHTQKLYHLYTNNVDTYTDLGNVKREHKGRVLNTNGLVVVKESYEAVPVKLVKDSPDIKQYEDEANRGAVLNFVRDGGELYKKGAYRGLFIMHKQSAVEGWVYSTIDEKNRITATGQIVSCVNCHAANARYEHLFGPR